MRVSVAVAALLAVSACAQVNPTIAELERAKTLAAAGNHAEVARLDAACAPTQPGCAQLRRVKADSCRRLADAAPREAPSEARRQALDCAAENSAAAFAAGRATPDAEAPPERLAVEMLDAAAARRDVASGREEALRLNTTLAARAREAEPVARPAALVFGADSELLAATLGAPSGHCEGVARAGAMLRQANAAGTPLAARAAALERAVGNAARARGCAP